MEKEFTLKATVFSWYRREGYGFARASNVDGDIMIHFSTIESDKRRKNLEEGEEVLLTLDMESRRLRCKKCVRLNPPEKKEKKLPAYMSKSFKVNYVTR